MRVDLLLKSHLKTLKLPTILQEYTRAARQCAQENRSFEEFLHYLAEFEVAPRQRKACQRRLKEAGFPTEKEIADFDFVALPPLNKSHHYFSSSIRSLTSGPLPLRWFMLASISPNSPVEKN